jgi:hypothetical protein
VSGSRRLEHGALVFEELRRPDAQRGNASAVRRKAEVE